ncbi:MAG: hypothetical protein ICV74_02725, partial [Thermoleophilia bacterium]|nr:hypothetical protein [Thermoleophilia bacterium]
MTPTAYRAAAPARSVPFLAALALALVLTGIGPAASGLPAPTPLAPPDGSSFELLPAFAWAPVARASQYEWELAADEGFNAKVAVATTANTRATARKVVANGRYFWRVRAVTADGDPGAWSPTRALRIAWSARPSLLSPSDGATLTYPHDAFRLSWMPVPGASEYLVRLATDEQLASIVWAGGPVRTSATSYTLSAPLAPGTYYWSITPVDAEGHAGSPSTTASFVWRWPSGTTPDFVDLAEAAEIVDPYFSWTPVPGAVGYEVEVNASSDWASGSKVCCPALRTGSRITTIGSSYSPREQLENNTYYWRVRALDPSGNAGVWSAGPTFSKTFANVPAITPPSVRNLRLRTNLDDRYDGADPSSVPYPLTTAVPVVTWDPVPGASSYTVDVTPFLGGACDWSYRSASHWTKTTSTTAWTPLGWGWNGVKPFPHPRSVSTDSSTLQAGWSYCIRVQPVDRSSTSGGPTAYGDWTYLPNSTVPAFTWSGGPDAESCSPCSLSASDYQSPVTGSTSERMPLFTWRSLAGAQSYFVLVARDPSFTNVVDYAFTRIPAYAPRQLSQSKGYADELTAYYWIVLPAREGNGGGVSATPLELAPPSFHKRTAEPRLLAPAPGAVLDGPVTFRWAPVEGARRYRLQVARDANFSNLVEGGEVTTDSTAYTSSTTYPADTVLYWRVQADAEDGSNFVGLSWSSPATFEKRLPAPVPDPANPRLGAFLPTLAWSPVPGAVSYDVHVEEPDGDQRDFRSLPSHAFTPTKMTGVGIFHFQARANFPTSSASVVPGPYSPVMSFARGIPEPAGASSDVGRKHIVLSWNPRLGAKNYRVQVSARADFSLLVENEVTQTVNYAPPMSNPIYREGGRLYWRVAAVDADNNTGDFTGSQQLIRAQVMRLRAL